jgi:hypothetical protein
MKVFVIIDVVFYEIDCGWDMVGQGLERQNPHKFHKRCGIKGIVAFMAE